ncbi:MAG TPA: murein biosynthesis integral membrane protein MurJ [Solirubrobacteraceae bacterium]|nr:murein biosynthesis integral membrane protein MurJ [Solirubrobacteraceae bacterium]
MSIESPGLGPGPPTATLSPPSGPPPRSALRRIAISTAIFALATALSRVAGLGREVVQAGYFGTNVNADAFTVASQIPNLVSNLFSMAALSAAFVPVFTELLQVGRRREAYRLASTLFWLILIVLTALTLVWMAAAGLIMPLFAGTLHPSAVALAAGLSRVLFPVVLLLSLTGLFVGILQSYDHFGVAAVAPAVWNVVIVIGLVALHPHFGIYGYAIAWLLATVVQFVMIAFALRSIDFRPTFAIDWKDPRVREVMILFVPVTVSIGIINIDSFLNATLGTLVSQHASIAINDAFRLYMLPQGIFSVAVTTVLFPTLTRMAIRADVAGMRRTIGNGVRQINLLLIPSAALMAVLATPITRLVFQRGHFTSGSTALVSTALLWFAFSLPFSGVNLLFTRTFFALRRPWIPTKLAAMNVALDIVVSLALYKSLHIAGLIIGTLVANMFMAWLQARRLRIGFNGRLESPQTLMITIRILVATAITTAVGYLIWDGLDRLLGLSLVAQILSVGIALLAAAAVYARLVLLMRIPEARQIEALLRSRLPGR